jgi:hypothetical protein
MSNSQKVSSFEYKNDFLYIVAADREDTGPEIENCRGK